MRTFCPRQLTCFFLSLSRDLHNSRRCCCRRLSQTGQKLKFRVALQVGCVLDHCHFPCLEKPWQRRPGAGPPERSQPHPPLPKESLVWRSLNASNAPPKNHPIHMKLRTPNILKTALFGFIAFLILSRHVFFLFWESVRVWFSWFQGTRSVAGTTSGIEWTAARAQRLECKQPGVKHPQEHAQSPECF